jgi:hypothetical protein
MIASTLRITGMRNPSSPSTSAAMAIPDPTGRSTATRCGGLFPPTCAA